MKITLTLISSLRPVFFTDRSTVSGMVDDSLFFCIPDTLLSLTKFPPIISVSCKNGMSNETKLHSKVKPRYYNEDNPGDTGRLATICNLMLSDKITL